MAAHSDDRPTIPSHSVRLAVYQPSLRPVLITESDAQWIQTSHGRARVIGRLGQRHQDIHDAIIITSLQHYREPDGRLRLLVDPAAVRRAIGEQYSHQRLWSMLKALMSAVVEWESAHRDKVRGLGHIIDDVVEARAPDGTYITAPDPRGGVRKLWRVTVGAAWAQSALADLALRYDVRAVSRLEHGVSQAVARHVLSHSTEPPGGWHVDTVLVAVGVRSGQATRDARRRLVMDASGLYLAGVALDTATMRLHLPERGTPAR